MEKTLYTLGFIIILFFQIMTNQINYHNILTKPLIPLNTKYYETDSKIKEIKFKGNLYYKEDNSIFIYINEKLPNLKFEKGNIFKKNEINKMIVGNNINDETAIGKLKKTNYLIDDMILINKDLDFFINKKIQYNNK